MTKAIIVNRNDDVDDDDPVLRPGETLRVPMPFMDSAVSATIVRVFGDAADSKVLHDGQGGPAGFRPGYAFGGSVPFAHHQRADGPVSAIDSERARGDRSRSGSAVGRVSSARAHHVW